jgi:IS5 family transposase
LGSSIHGRAGQYTTEQILRALVVMFVEHSSYRATVVRIENSEFLRNFVRLGVRPAMDFTFLSKAFSAMSAETWKRMNEALASYGKQEGRITADKVRLDTTAYEADIHWPTDSSLLWDGFRTLARLLKKSSGALRGLGRRHRFHLKKIKRLAQFIARHAASRSKRMQREVKTRYRTLIERARKIVAVAREAAILLEKHARLETAAVVEQIRGYVPIVARIVDQAERRVLKGEKVPSSAYIPHFSEVISVNLSKGADA